MKPPSMLKCIPHCYEPRCWASLVTVELGHVLVACQSACWSSTRWGGVGQGLPEHIVGSRGTACCTACRSLDECQPKCASIEICPWFWNLGRVFEYGMVIHSLLQLLQLLLLMYMSDSQTMPPVSFGCGLLLELAGAWAVAHGLWATDISLSSSQFAIVALLGSMA